MFLLLLKYDDVGSKRAVTMRGRCGAAGSHDAGGPLDDSHPGRKSLVRVCQPSHTVTVTPTVTVTALDSQSGPSQGIMHFVFPCLAPWHPLFEEC